MIINPYSYPAAGGGPPQFDNASATVGLANGAQTISFTVATQSNRVLLVDITYFDVGGRSISGVTYNGDALAQLDQQLNSSGYGSSERWWMVAPDQGTFDVVVTIAGPPVEYVISPSSWYDVNQSTPFGTTVGAEGNSTTPSIDVSSAAGEVVVATIGAANATSITTGTGQTRRSTANDAGQIFGEVSSEAGAGTVTMSGTFGASYLWSIIGTPLKPV